MPGPSEILGKIAGKAKGLTASGIYKQLKQDHGEVSVMMKRVAASSDARTRRDLFPKIRVSLLAHAKAEEKEFYTPLIQHPQMSGKIQHSKQEHAEIERLLDTLASMDMSSETWDSTFKQLKHSVEEHVKEEENVVFEKAQSIFSDEQSKEMERRFLDEKKRFQHAIS